jgi:hypothetical protein
LVSPAPDPLVKRDHCDARETTRGLVAISGGNRFEEDLALAVNCVPLSALEWL